jgi:hypothetical protein
MGLAAKKTEPDRPWADLPIHVSWQIRDFFAVAIYSEVCDGTTTLFWIDWWLYGQTIADLAAHHLAIISARRRKKRTEHEILNNHAWILDIHGALTIGVFIEYLQLWDILHDCQLQPDSEDKHIWMLLTNGKYSAKSAYEGFFLGSTLFGPCDQNYKTWALAKCHFFMWLPSGPQEMLDSRSSSTLEPSSLCKLPNVRPRGRDHWPRPCPLSGAELRVVVGVRWIL